MLPVKTQFSIQEAGKACDLNPSVLRIWEARYGWPKPQRKKNGYRVYDYQQVEELKRIAELVRSGHTISTLVQDGQPVIPRQSAPTTSPYARLETLPLPVEPAARRVHLQLLEALRHQQYGAARGLIERANWDLHPRQLVQACYLPTLVALAEIQRLPSSSPAQDPSGQRLLREAIAARCQELLHRYPADKRAIAVIALDDEAETLASAVCLSLNLAGKRATVLHCRKDAARGQRVITVSDKTSPLDIRGTIGHCSALENDRYWTITDLPHCVPDTSAANN